MRNKEKHLVVYYGERMVLGDPQTSSQIRGLVDSSIDTTDPTLILTPILKQNHWQWRRVTSDEPPFGHRRIHAMKEEVVGVHHRSGAKTPPTWVPTEE